MSNEVEMGRFGMFRKIRYTSTKLILWGLFINTVGYVLWAETEVGSDGEALGTLLLYAGIALFVVGLVATAVRLGTREGKS